jgi:hypothetical protein
VHLPATVKSIAADAFPKLCVCQESNPALWCDYGWSPSRWRRNGNANANGKQNVIVYLTSDRPGTCDRQNVCFPVHKQSWLQHPDSHMQWNHDDSVPPLG